MDAKHGFLHFPQPCAANHAWSDCRLDCKMSAVCLWYSMPFWQRAGISPIISDSPISENLFIIFLLQPTCSLAPIKKKPHTSWQFLMWSPCHVLHLHQLFLFVMDSTRAFFHFSKCFCRQCVRRILIMWAITCQCSGKQPALDRFRSGNSSDDKEHRRSTRWPTPAHFLFKSASTPGSCKLFPVRKGLPVVLCWL